MREATVIGCGVIGLSCAVRLQEAGFSVCIVAERLPPDTISNWAAAIWYPFKAHPEENVLAWGMRTYRELVGLADEPAAPVAMIEFLEVFETETPEPWWRDAVRGFRRARPETLPAGYRDGFLFETPVMPSGPYLTYLMSRFQAAGGRIREQRVDDLADWTGKGKLIVNCSGLGARELARDPSVYPIRGQIARVAAAGPARAFLDQKGPRALTYIVPRGADVVLGGTAEEGDWNTEPEPATAARILERCREVEPALAEMRLLRHGAALRPARPAVRLELDADAEGALIHCYGHGGSGFTLSWGCADEALALARKIGT